MITCPQSAAEQGGGGHVLERAGRAQAALAQAGRGPLAAARLLESQQPCQPARPLSVGADSLPQPGGGGGAAAPAPAGGAPDLAPPRAAGGSPSFDAPAQLWVLNTVERLLKFDRKAAAQQVGAEGARAEERLGGQTGRPVLARQPNNQELCQVNSPGASWCFRHALQGTNSVVHGCAC